MTAFLIKILLVAGVTAGSIVYTSNNPRFLESINTIFLPKQNTTRSQTEKKPGTEKQTVKIPKEVERSARGVVEVVQKSAEDVLGSVSKLVETTASASAEKAREVVVQETVKKLVEQIDKLPEKDQEEIRNQICK